MMDPKQRSTLQTNRTKIIENVANPQDVVDSLFSRGIFTESMKQEVEAEKTQIQQVRRILDITPRRGPLAYNTLYECLVDSHNYDAAEILWELYTGQYPRGGSGEGVVIVPPGGDILPEEWPNELIMSEDVRVTPCNVRSELVTHHWISDRVYSMKKRCRGRCLIISNKEFYGPLAKDKSGVLRCILAPRQGTDKDVNDLKNLFEQLHFNVVVRQHLTAQEMNDVLRSEASRPDLESSECYVCIICSHGTSTGIYGVDGKTISLETVSTCFDGTNCPALSDKPKLFFIQACQGENEDRPGSDNLDGNLQTITQLLEQTHIPNTTDSEPFQNDQLDASKVTPRPLNPTKSHILVACATHPGYVSLRNIHYGSWFIQAIVYIFQKFACTEDIYGLLTLVNDLVARGRTRLNADGPRNVTQASLFHSSLRRKFMFFPGVISSTEL